METRRSFPMTKAMGVRMAADAAMVSLAFVVALALRFLVFVAASKGANVDLADEFWQFATAFAHNVIPLTILCLIIFRVSGFYTYGRAYQGKYKALIVVQAVTQAYVFYGILTYLVGDRLMLFPIPRGALVLAWALNLGMSLASRTWTFLWEQVVRPEKEAALNGGDKPIRSVLVIGGAGYIGSALLPKLLTAGYRVRVLDMFLFGTDPIADVADHRNLELIQGDFRHVDGVVKAMQGMDAVIHLGAIVGDPACNLDEDVTVGVNLSATQMIAQVAKATGISRFIFASTCSVYGACDELLDERSEVKPISLYGHTKLAAERGLQGMADETFKPTILRFATIYGLSGRTRFDLVINLLSAKAKTEGIIPIHGGNQWRPFVHVDDAALGVFTALKASVSIAGNETFNVGSDEQNHTICEVGELVHAQVFGATLDIQEDASDARNYRVSFQKIRNVLNYEPEWTIDEGIRQVVEAVAGGDVTDYRDPKYSNVKFLGETGAIELVQTDDSWQNELAASQSSEQLTS